MRRALVVTYGGGHSAMMAPAVRELLDRGRVHVSVLGLTTGGAAYQAAGIPHKGYRHYVRPGRDDGALELGRTLLGDVHGAAVGVPAEESVAYLGLSMQDLVDRLGRQEAFARYRRDGRHAFLQLGVLRRIVEAERPDVVVATNSPKSERAAILEANRAGIPSLMVPDLFADPRWETYSPFEARWYAAMDELTARNLAAHHGAAPERVVVTGQPAFQKRRPDRAAAQAATCAGAGFSDTRPYVLAAASWDAGEPGRPGAATMHQSLAVLRALASHPAGAPWRIVVKPHPSQPAAPLADAARGNPAIGVCTPRLPIDTAVGGAVGVLLATTTTVAMDALTMDVPVIAANLSGRPSSMPYGDLGIPEVTDPRALPGALTGFVERPPDGQAAVRARMAAANGRAKENVADLVERICREDA